MCTQGHQVMIHTYRDIFFYFEHSPYLVPVLSLKNTDQCIASICSATNYTTNLSRMVEM
jgi:hypothetical protein